MYLDYCTEQLKNDNKLQLQHIIMKNLNILNSIWAFYYNYLIFSSYLFGVSFSNRETRYFKTQKKILDLTVLLHTVSSLSHLGRRSLPALEFWRSLNAYIGSRNSCTMPTLDQKRSGNA